MAANPVACRIASNAISAEPTIPLAWKEMHSLTKLRLTNIGWEQSPLALNHATVSRSHMDLLDSERSGLPLSSFPAINPVLDVLHSPGPIIKLHRLCPWPGALWSRRDSNPRPMPCKGITLPLSYTTVLDVYCSTPSFVLSSRLAVHVL